MRSLGFPVLCAVAAQADTMHPQLGARPGDLRGKLFAGMAHR